jgi:predicted metal-dependent peptidase
MDIEAKALLQLAKARAYVKKRAPYVQATLYMLVPVSAPGLGTIGVTDHLVMPYDAEWVVTLSVEALGGVIMHEIMHVVRGLERIRKLQPRFGEELTNISADIPINQDLRTAEWILPLEGAFPEKYGVPVGLTMEEYCILLSKEAEKQSKSAEQMLSEMRGKQSQDSGQGKKSKGQQPQPQQQPKGPSICDGKCGGVGGNKLPNEGQYNKKLGRSKADQQRARKQTINDIRKALKSGGEGRGNMPGFLEELLKEMPETPSVIPWRQQLSRVVRRATGRIISGRADFSIRRPSKRSYVRGIIRPGMVDRKVVIAFVEDSSGSMGPNQIKATRREILGIFKQMGLDEGWFLQADAGVTIEPKRVKMRDLRDIPVAGRGGTNFCPAFVAAEKIKPRPDLLVYLTDGDGRAPNRPPKNMEVVWCIVPSHYNKSPTDWGHTVFCSDDQLPGKRRRECKETP